MVFSFNHVLLRSRFPFLPGLSYVIVNIFEPKIIIERISGAPSLFTEAV